MTFKLDKVLESDTIAIGDTPNYAIRLANDNRFPWVILIPKVPSITEVYQLEASVQQRLAIDSSVLGSEMMDLYKGDSLNTGALGNVVSQLHLHHVVRYKKDAAWPGPVWGCGKPKPYNLGELEERLRSLRQSLSICSV